MPIYEFECVRGHRTEKIFSISECPTHIMCPSCPNFFHVAEKVWSLPGNIQIGKPTRIFVNNQTGDTFSPFSEYDKPPAGYKELELKDPIARSKFEREQQRRKDAENQLTSHVLDSMKNDAVKKRHDNLKAKMNAVQRETFVNKEGKEETVEFTLDHKDKALLNKAMERTKKKPMKHKKTEMMLAVNHNDNSNLDQLK